MSQSQSLGSDRQDREWKSRVSVLEHELKETKDYYLKRIEALEKGHTPAPGTVLSDSTLIVAAESLASADQKIGIGGVNEMTKINKEDLAQTEQPRCT